MQQLLQPGLTLITGTTTGRQPSTQAGAGDMILGHGDIRVVDLDGTHGGDQAGATIRDGDQTGAIIPDGVTDIIRDGTAEAGILAEDIITTITDHTIRLINTQTDAAHRTTTAVDVQAHPHREVVRTDTITQADTTTDTPEADPQEITLQVLIQVQTTVIFRPQEDAHPDISRQVRQTQMCTDQVRTNISRQATKALQEVHTTEQAADVRAEAHLKAMVLHLADRPMKEAARQEVAEEAKAMAEADVVAWAPAEVQEDADNTLNINKAKNLDNTYIVFLYRKR